MKKVEKKILSLVLLSLFVLTNFSSGLIVNATQKDEQIESNNQTTTSSINEFKDNPLSDEELSKIKNKKLSREADYVEQFAGNTALNYSTTSPIVVLIKFKGQSDEEAYSKEEINEIKESFCGEKYSLKDYLETVSYGQCSVNPQFIFDKDKKVLIYEAPYPKEYYSPYDEVMNPIGYTNFYDRTKLLMDAFAFIKDKLPDNVDYDIDKDGYYDCVDFLVPAQTEWNTFLWPHKSSVHDSEGVTEKNGCKLNTYNLITKERILDSKYKVVTHEYLHTLGYPDFYVYNKASFENPMDEWSIMATSNGFQSVYERIAYSGWISENDVKTISEEGIYKIDNAAMSPKNHDIAYRINIPNTNQYFMIEYRDKSANIYTNENIKSGIVSYRIDDSRRGNSEGDPEVYTLRNEHLNTVINNSGEEVKLILSSGEETGYKIQYVKEENGQAYFKLIKYTPNQEKINITGIDVDNQYGQYIYTVNVDNPNGKDLRYTYLSLDKNNNETALLSNSESNVYQKYGYSNIKVVVSDGNGAIGIAFSNNTDIINKISIDKGTTIKFQDTAKISIDLLDSTYKDKYNYSFIAYLGDIKEVINNVTSYDDVISCEWKPQQTGEYTIRAIAMDSDGETIDEETIRVNVTDSMLINMSQNSPVELGDKITLTAKGSNLDENYKYKFSVLFDGKEEILSDFADKNSIVWEPSEGGKYQIKIQMRDTNNNITERIVDYDVEFGEIINGLEINGSLKSGEEIEAIIESNYKNEEFTYSAKAIYYGNDGEEDLGYILQDSRDDKFKFKFNEMGSYEFIIYLKYKGEIIQTYYKDIYIEGNIKPKIITSVDSPQKVDTPIIINTSAEGKGKYEYKCLIYSNGNLELTSDYMENLNVKWIPKHSGDYIIEIKAKDERGKIESVSKSYTITNNIKITDVKASSNEYYGPNTKIDITFDSEGGDGDNRYYVYVENYYTTNILLFDSTEKKCQYQMDIYMENVNIKVIAVDRNGNFDVYYKKLDIIDARPQLIITPNDRITVDDVVELKAIPYSEGNYKYRFAVAYGTNFDWEVIYGEEEYLNEFSDESTISWKPSKEGDYKIIVQIKDENGEIITNEKYIFVEEGKPIYIKDVTINSSNNMMAKYPITIKTEVYSKEKLAKLVYFIYKDDSMKLITEIDSTDNSITWTPLEEGNYTIVVKAYDSNNNMDSVSKKIKINKNKKDEPKEEENKNNKPNMSDNKDSNGSNMAKTGDNNKLDILIIALMISGLVIITLMIRNKKNKSNC
ncbi:MAG: hypothetical protein SOZ71_10275 [Clostridium sp.]|nr:hypothetical protein [Clostridium sp.]